MHKSVYKISGNPGILTPKIDGGLPDFSTWESAGLPCFTPSVHRYLARMPTDFGGLPDLMAWESAGLPCFFLNLHTAPKHMRCKLVLFCKKKNKSTLRTLVVSTILADSEIVKDDNSHAHLPIVPVLQELKFIRCSIQSLQL